VYRIFLPKNDKKYYVFHYTTVLQLCIEEKYFIFISIALRGYIFPARRATRTPP